MIRRSIKIPLGALSRCYNLNNSASIARGIRSHTSISSCSIFPKNSRTTKHCLYETLEILDSRSINRSSELRKIPISQAAELTVSEESLLELQLFLDSVDRSLSYNDDQIIDKDLLKMYGVKPVLRRKNRNKLRATEKRVSLPRYGLSEAEIQQFVSIEMKAFFEFMTTPRFDSIDPPIAAVTAETVIRKTALLLGWLVHVKKSFSLEESNSSSPLRFLFPNLDSESARTLQEYLRFLKEERGGKPGNQSFIVRASIKIVKFLHHNELVKVIAAGGKLCDVPLIKELCEMNANYTRASKMKTDETSNPQKWISWPEFLHVVTKLRDQCTTVTSTGKKRTNWAIAMSFQRYLICAILASVPDRQRTIRELRVGKTMMKKQNGEFSGRWVIKHSSNDYKTGKYFGDRPPLVLSAEITSKLEEFLLRWRKYLNPEHDFVFSKVRGGAPLSACSVHSIVSTAIHNVSGKVTNPHLLRDAIITHVRGRDNSERDLEALALYMGHSLSTQQKCYDKRTLQQKCEPAIDLISEIRAEVMNIEVFPGIETISTLGILIAELEPLANSENMKALFKTKKISLKLLNRRNLSFKKHGVSNNLHAESKPTKTTSMASETPPEGYSGYPTPPNEVSRHTWLDWKILAAAFAVSGIGATFFLDPMPLPAPPRQVLQTNDNRVREDVDPIQKPRKEVDQAVATHILDKGQSAENAHEHKPIAELDALQDALNTQEKKYAVELQRLREEIELKATQLDLQSSSDDEIMKDKLDRMIQDTRRELQMEFEEERLKLQKELEETIQYERDAMLKHYGDESATRAGTLDALSQHVESFEEMIMIRDQVEALHRRISLITGIVVEIENSVASEDPFPGTWKTLYECSIGNDLLEHAALSVPDSIPKHGVQGGDLLRNRFTVVEAAARQASLVPRNSGIWGHVLAFLTCRIIFRDRRYIEGDDDLSIISRAGYFVEEGDFAASAAELEKLSQIPKELCHDWIEDVHRMIVVQQALKVIKSELQLLSLVDLLGKSP